MERTRTEKMAAELTRRGMTEGTAAWKKAWKRLEKQMRNDQMWFRNISSEKLEAMQHRPS